MENDLFQLWRLVVELSDQLSQNRAITASLQAQAGSVKVGIVSSPVIKAHLHPWYSLRPLIRELDSP